MHKRQDQAATVGASIAQWAGLGARRSAAFKKERLRGSSRCEGTRKDRHDPPFHQKQVSYVMLIKSREFAPKSAKTMLSINIGTR